MRVLGFGAIVWDNIPDAQGRPAMNLGGAVLNVMAHLQRLGHEARMVSAVGDDDLGRRTLSAVADTGVGIDLIGTVDAPSCLVRVEFAEDGEPSYIIEDDVCWDHIAVDSRHMDTIDRQRCDAFCFGSIEQRSAVSRAALRRLLENVTFGRTFLDINLREPFYSKEVIDYSLRHCEIAKINLDEAAVIREMFDIDVTDTEAMLRRIRETFGIDRLCATAGGRGAYYSDGDGFGFCEAYRVNVVDTVGAGDAFSAGLLHALDRGNDLQAACDFGCRMGALVASKTSSIPDYDPADLPRRGCRK